MSDSITTKEIMLYYGPYEITPTLLYYAWIVLFWNIW